MRGVPRQRGASAQYEGNTRFADQLKRRVLTFLFLHPLRAAGVTILWRFRLAAADAGSLGKPRTKKAPPTG